MKTEETIIDPAPEAEPRTDSSPVKALLIEDNPGDARLIQIMLAATDDGFFELEHVQRLEAGLQRIAQGGIGIVLADLSLPDSHGLETFSRLHARAPEVPIIVLSGLNDTALAVLAFTWDTPPVRWNFEFAWTLAFSSILATAIGWWLWTDVLARTPAGIAGLNALSAVGRGDSSWLRAACGSRARNAAQRHHPATSQRFPHGRRASQIAWSAPCVATSATLDGSVSFQFEPGAY